jgi:integrase
MPRPRSSLKRPLQTPAEADAVLAAARSLSPAHHEVVLLLLATGIELRALSRLTWREVLPDALLWRRPRGRGDLRVPVSDPRVAAAAASLAERPPRSCDQLDRLVRAAFRATGAPGLHGGSAMTLRLTHCAALLRQGLRPEEAAQRLSLAPALVRHLAAERARAPAAPDEGEE